VTLRQFIVTKILKGEINLYNPAKTVFSRDEDYTIFWDLVDEVDNKYFGTVNQFLKEHPEYLEVTKLDRYLYADN
jgi:hypothetical protein